MTTVSAGVNRRFVQVIGIGVAVSLYYASQWTTETVQIAPILPLGTDLATAPWVNAIDHHLVQLCFALGCIWYLSSGNWRSWGLTRRTWANRSGC